jgi:hypothetical protein
MFCTWLAERVHILWKKLDAHRIEARYIKRIDKALRNPYLTEQHKEMLRDKVKQLEIDKIESLAGNLKRRISDLNNHS